MGEALQFGVRVAGHAYVDRPTVFGIALKDGRLACVRVARAAGDYYDLPGGAIDPGEDEARALVREFGEETGLRVRAGAPFARAAQFMLKSDGRAVNNISGFWTAEVEALVPGLKKEADHTLVWLDPVEAARRLRHDAYAWAVLAWLRRGA